MKALLNRLTNYWSLAVLLSGFFAWGFYDRAKTTGLAGDWVVVAVCVIVGVGMAMRWRWARVVCIGLLIGLVTLKAYGLVVRAFSWRQLLYAVGMSYFAYGLWKKPNEGFVDDFAGDDNPDGDDENPEPMISLVHLRRQPRYLEPVVLANALSEAWGLKIAGGDGDPPDDADGFVAGGNPLFMVMVQKPTFAMFMVHNHDRSYFDDANEVADGVPNLRFAEIIRDHASWLAVDLMQAKETALGQDDAYRLIGKAISALADDDVMAIMCPQHHFFNLWSPELEEILCGDSPLDALREEVKAPVYGVPDGETIEGAVAEARRRWPEFVTAFKMRDPDNDLFIVKAPFTGENGEVEHMWLSVFGLEPEYVHGHLINDPIHTTKLKNGSQVEVPVAEISDWVCAGAEGKPLGNFTHQAVERAANAKLKD